MAKSWAQQPTSNRRVSLSAEMTPGDLIARLETRDVEYLLSRSVDLTKTILIGRSQRGGDVDVDMGDCSVISRRHLEIRFKAPEFFLRCSSKNGIFVNGVFHAQGQRESPLPSECTFRFPDTDVLLYFESLVASTKVSSVSSASETKDNLSPAPPASSVGKILDSSEQPIDDCMHATSAGPAAPPSSELVANPAKDSTGQALILLEKVKIELADSPIDPFGGSRHGVSASAADGMGEAPSGIGPQTVETDDEERPLFSFIQLIAQAISTSLHRQLTESGIFGYIRRKYPYFRKADRKWQNVIRRKLKLNKFFLKVVRAHQVPPKPTVWRLSKQSEAKLIANAFRMRKQRAAAQRPGVSFSRRAEAAPYHVGGGTALDVLTREGPTQPEQVSMLQPPSQHVDNGQANHAGENGSPKPSVSGHAVMTVKSPKDPGGAGISSMSSLQMIADEYASPPSQPLSQGSRQREVACHPRTFNERDGSESAILSNSVPDAMTTFRRPDEEPSNAGGTDIARFPILGDRFNKGPLDPSIPCFISYATGSVPMPSIRNQDKPPSVLPTSLVVGEGTKDILNKPSAAVIATSSELSSRSSNCPPPAVPSNPSTNPSPGSSLSPDSSPNLHTSYGVSSSPRSTSSVDSVPTPTLVKTTGLTSQCQNGSTSPPSLSSEEMGAHGRESGGRQVKDIVEVRETRKIVGAVTPRRSGRKRRPPQRYAWSPLEDESVTANQSRGPLKSRKRTKRGVGAKRGPPSSILRKVERS